MSISDEELRELRIKYNLPEASSVEDISYLLSERDRRSFARRLKLDESSTWDEIEKKLDDDFEAAMKKMFKSGK